MAEIMCIIEPVHSLKLLSIVSIRLRDGLNQAPTFMDLEMSFPGVQVEDFGLHIAIH